MLSLSIYWSTSPLWIFGNAWGYIASHVSESVFNHTDSCISLQTAYLHKHTAHCRSANTKELDRFSAFSSTEEKGFLSELYLHKVIKESWIMDILLSVGHWVRWGRGTAVLVLKDILWTLARSQMTRVAIISNSRWPDCVIALSCKKSSEIPEF